MQIAFKFYDIEQDECVSKKNVEMVLRHITKEDSSSRYGISFEKEGNIAKSSRYDLAKKQQRDMEEIKKFSDALF